MRIPLLIRVYVGLCRGYNRLSREARGAVRLFVKSQKRGVGYANPGGKQDDYYTQFGEVLEAVFSPWKVLGISRTLTVKESEGKDTVYDHFFRFISDELKFKPVQMPSIGKDELKTANAVCCYLCMQHQSGRRCDEALVKWLKERQDASGGFYSSEVAPVPDMLTTAVALFTLRLIGKKAKDATDFIDAHFLECGGFAPTIYDDYSDVEYVFYGLLSLL